MTDTLPTPPRARHPLRHAARTSPSSSALIRELAVYEKLEHLATATPARLEPQLFGDQPGLRMPDRRAATASPSASRCSSTTSRPSCAARACTWRTCSCGPTARGTGLGKRLLQRLAQIAVERDCGRFEWSVLDWNVDAQAFYERMGATMLPDWRICRVTGDALQALGGAA